MGSPFYLHFDRVWYYDPAFAPIVNPKKQSFLWRVLEIPGVLSKHTHVRALHHSTAWTRL